MDLYDILSRYLAPYQTRYRELLEHPETMEAILKKNAESMNERIEQCMREVTRVV